MPFLFSGAPVPAPSLRHQALYRGTRLAHACAFSLLLAAPAAATAQQAALLGASSIGLPEAPQPQASDTQTAPAQGSATIHGTVLDASGAAIAGAQISLSLPNGSQQRVLTSGAAGSFNFTGIAPGSYIVIVNANGFALFTSMPLTVAAQQAFDMSPIALKVSTASTDVTVRPTEVIAAEQIKQEEKQRAFGIIPNFYTSYTYDAAPLTTKQKYSLAGRDEFDWTTFLGAGIASGIQQANNSFAGYGQGAAGYGKRYAANFGNALFGNYLAHAVYPALFHQDPRYYYQGSGTWQSRARHAASFAVIVRNDKGQNVPNYSFLFADMTAGAISNLYYPHADRGLNLVFTNTLIGIAGRAAGTVLLEFISKKITTNVPGDGKP